MYFISTTIKIVRQQTKKVSQRGTLKLTQIDTLETSMWEIALIPLTARFDDCFLVRMWYVDFVRLLALLLTSKKIWTFESIKKTVLLSDMFLCHVITQEHFFETAHLIFANGPVETGGNIRN